MNIIEVQQNGEPADGRFDSILEDIAGLDERVFSANIWGLEAYSASAANSYDVLLTAVDADSGLAGFALLRCFDDAELIRIAVDESMRRHGIGRALMERLISEAETRRVSSIFLEVRSSNLPAIAMYEAAGFTREGVRRGYYSAPKEDALIMKYSCRQS